MTQICESTTTWIDATEVLAAQGMTLSDLGPLHERAIEAFEDGFFELLRCDERPSTEMARDIVVDASRTLIQSIHEDLGVGEMILPVEMAPELEHLVARIIQLGFDLGRTFAERRSEN